MSLTPVLPNQKTWSQALQPDFRSPPGDSDKCSSLRTTASRRISLSPQKAPKRCPLCPAAHPIFLGVPFVKYPPSRKTPSNDFYLLHKVAPPSEQLLQSLLLNGFLSDLLGLSSVFLPHQSLVLLLQIAISSKISSHLLIYPSHRHPPLKTPANLHSLCLTAESPLLYFLEHHSSSL